MFRINPFKTSREEKDVPNKDRASVRIKPITVSQPPVFTKKVVNSNSNGLSSTGVDNTKTKRPSPRRNTKNDRVPSASTSSCNKNKGVEVEEHHRNLPLSKNKKHMSSVCIARLKFRYLSVLPYSFAVTYASATFSCIGRDVIPKSSEFSSEHYATLVVYPAPFHKYPEPFLCLGGMSRNYTLDENTYPQFLRNDDEEIDLLSFIRIVDPTKVRIGERQRDENEPKLLETTVGRVVPLLPVAPDRSFGELEASVEKLFGEGGSGEQAEQGDSAGGGHGVSIDVVVETSVEDVSLAQLKRQKKQKTKVADAGEPLHPAKKLRDDYGAPGGPTVGGKSQSSIQRLLAEAVQNVEVRGGAMPTFPFVSSSISTTLEREGEYHTKLLDGVNLYTIGAPQRFVISSDSSDHSGVNITEAEVDSIVRTSMPIITSATTTTPTADPATIAKEKLVGSFVFGADSLSAGGSHPIPGGFSDLSGSDFIVGGIRTVIEPDSNLQKVYVPQWNVTNGFCLDDGGVSHQISLSAEISMRAECHIKEKRRLKAIVEEKDQVLKARDEEIKNLKARLLFKEAKAAKAIRLRAETSQLEAAEKSLRDEVTALNERNTILEKERNALDVKVTDLQAVVVSKDCELTNSFAQLAY
nr:transposase (putative), gypsy type [Tanacetum cinerariifolium]